MRILAILALLAAFAAPVNAQIAPEAGVGIAHATAHGDGTWWQRAFPHQLKMNQPAVMVGLRYAASQHWAFHADAIWLGHYYSDALAVPNDAAYNRHTDQCTNPCPPLAHWHGRGWVGVLSFPVEWHSLGRWQYGFRGGPIFYREAWRMDVPDWYTANQQPDGSWKVIYRTPIHRSDTRWALSYSMGAFVTRGRWTLSLDLYRDGKTLPGYGGDDPPIWRYHTVLSISRSF